ncbi:MAG: hypothetical protein VR65_18895 [Desulfobulbaceae bacterium BRH_c16a]|nr:MAG: hypothetical protein VR65_18895 [Desulfobulbaceae bacterium BRH_c16a]
MTEIHKNPDTTQDSPFQDKIVLENFYPGANRGEVLCLMTEALERGVALMVLSGEEGSGKTMLCRMLESSASRFCITVFFPHTVESFEDVVKVVAMRMGLKADAAGQEGKSIEAMLNRITAQLKQESTGLLIIFDEAENIYLATLERVRKMLDRVTHAGAHMYIVFSGRKTFLENCNQLSLCDFKTSTELLFDLAPLSEQETAEYLRTCSMKLEGPDRKKVFNDEVVRNIFSLAKGNFRTTNLLAEESLSTHGDDTSFMVLLESVKEEAESEEGATPQNTLHLFKRYAHYVPWIGGVGCVLLLLFFLMRPGGGERVAAQPNVDSEKGSAENVQVEVREPAESTTIEEKAIVVKPSLDSEALPPGPDNVQESTQELLSDSGAVDKNTGFEEATPPVIDRAISVEVVQQTTEVEVQPTPPPAKVVIPPPSVEKVIVLRQDKPLKRKKGVDSDSKGPVRLQSRTEAQTQPNARLSVNRLLQKRVSAGVAWAKGVKEDAYTMQLMVLTDKNAEGNLKKMLEQPRYRQEAGNFFIFKKAAGSEIIFVFYGEYPNLAKARLAQNSLPSFLRDHQPYAISIKGAMAKVTK